MAGDYIKCPRCELNYIHKNQGYCDVCKAELKLGPQLVFAVEEDDEEPMELCPICKQNYIKEGEEMCAKCREEMDFKKDEIDLDKDEEWKNYLEEDADDEEMLSLSRLAEEEADELFDDEEDEEADDVGPDEPDDFEIPEIDERDFEEEDEDEEEEDEDDEFDDK